MAKRFFLRRIKEPPSTKIEAKSIYAKAPPAKEVKLRKADRLGRFEMIIEWFSDNRPFKYQRLGFKVDGDLVAATKKAQDLCDLLSRSATSNPKLMGEKFCRVIAVFAESAFKDWSAENAGYFQKTKQDNKELVKTILQDASSSKPRKKGDIRVR